jgi:hypothetical protein
MEARGDQMIAATTFRDARTTHVSPIFCVNVDASSGCVLMTQPYVQY